MELYYPLSDASCIVFVFVCVCLVSFFVRAYLKISGLCAVQ
jgi:hypothetical protein